MSRSASDATRFTATGPYASSKSFDSSHPTSRWSSVKSNPSNSSPNPNNNGNMQETAREKVDRLRAQARAKRIASSKKPMDQIIEGGRSWADRFHRATVITLIAASGIAGVLTVYSMSSLIVHNRRQKQLWIERELFRLSEAKRAYVAGTTTMEQLEMLEKERVGELAAMRKQIQKQQTTYAKTKRWLFGGPEPVVEGYAEIPVTAVRENDDMTRVSVSELVAMRRQQAGGDESAPSSILEQARQQGKELQQQQAHVQENVSDIAQDGKATKSKWGWFSKE